MHPFSGMKKFALALERSSSFDAAMDALAEAAFEAGFPMVDYSYLPAARLSCGDWMAPPLSTRGFPQAWDRKWDRHRRHDAYYHACFEGYRIVDWSTIKRRRNLSAPEKDSVSYLDDQQIVSGVTIPVHLPGGRFAFISGASTIQTDYSGARAEALLSITHYFYRTISVTFDNPFRDSSRLRGQSQLLSSQELQALTWAAKGKTADDISCILRKSPDTVRAQLKRAITKLNATNCAHAVAKAVYLELVDMEGDVGPRPSPETRNPAADGSL